MTSVSLDQGAPRHLRLVRSGELDHGLTREWISEILRSQGNDMFRMKGILSVAHASQRYVYHSVHMLMSGSFDTLWGEAEPRLSKMVFIGRNLDAKALADRFNACLATPENLAAKAVSLRFAVGDRVECRTGRSEWTTGVVHALNYRDERMPPGMVAPYQVLLDGEGGFIWAPKDDDAVVRMLVEEVEAMDDDDDDEEDEEEQRGGHGGGVRDLLGAIGLEQYADVFEDQDIDLEVLRDFQRKRGRNAVEETLGRLGVASAEHRTKIADAVAGERAERQAEREEHSHTGHEHVHTTFS